MEKCFSSQKEKGNPCLIICFPQFLRVMKSPNIQAWCNLNYLSKKSFFSWTDYDWLGLWMNTMMKHTIKCGTKKHTKCLLYLNSMPYNLPKLSEAKLKGGVLNGPDIRQLTSNEQKEAWQSLIKVSHEVLGKYLFEYKNIKY